jgi:tetratricopeptide (TPR) repeat protein
VWGTVDQVRHYLALRSDDAHDLQRAALLDSFDSPLQMRLADRELRDGHPEQAEVAWRKAIQSNPADQAPREALLRFMVEQKRFDEALALTDASLKYSPVDANLLVDRGFLALRLGHPDQAVDSWKRAITADPGQMPVHLYLANELDHEGKAQDAAAHYTAFLTAVAQQPAAKRPEPEKVIAIALRMADCQARASEKAQSVQSYELAAKIAAQTKQPKLESIADVNEAALQAEAGKLGEALQLYQHAVQLDDSIGDRTSSAEDWFAYGRFLDNAGFPARLVYACLVKSTSLQDSLPEASQRQALTEASQRAESRLGPTAASIRRDPEPLLRRALGLRQ